MKWLGDEYEVRHAHDWLIPAIVLVLLYVAIAIYVNIGDQVEWHYEDVPEIQPDKTRRQSL